MAIGEWVAGRFKRLAEGRQEPGRGTHDNIPWWKVMLVAGYVGWTLAWIVVNLAFSGQWSQAEEILVAAGYSAIAITHILAAVLFC